MYKTKDIKPLNRGFFGKGESKKERINKATGTNTESLIIRVKKVAVIN